MVLSVKVLCGTRLIFSTKQATKGDLHAHLHRYFLPVSIIEFSTLHRTMRALPISLLLMFTCCANAHADGLPPLTWTEVQPQSQLWVNAGFYSFHFDPSLGLNNSNYGLGVEYRYSSTSSLTVGQFYNSDRVTSHYAGMYWEPVTWGKVKLGAVIGGFDGYPHMLNGGWFPAVIPVASVEYDRVGANIAFVPTIQNRLYGAVSVQLKVKLF